MQMPQKRVGTVLVPESDWWSHGRRERSCTDPGLRVKRYFSRTGHSLIVGLVAGLTGLALAGVMTWPSVAAAGEPSTQTQPADPRDIVLNQSASLEGRMDALSRLAHDAESQTQWQSVQSLFIDLLVEQANEPQASQLIRGRFLGEFKRRDGHLAGARAYIDEKLADAEAVGLRQTLVAMREQIDASLSPTIRRGPQAAALQELIFLHLQEVTSAHLQANRYDTAKQVCLNVADSSPDSPLLAAAMSRLFEIFSAEAGSDVEATSAAYLAAVGGHGKHLAYAELVVALAEYERGRLEQANQQLDHWISSHPGSPWTGEALMGKALCQIGSESHEEALGSLQQLVDDYPLSTQASKGQFLIAWIHLSAQRMDKAIEALKVVVADHPETTYAEKANDLLYRLEP